MGSSDDTFAALFEAQGKSAAARKKVRVGETLEAVIIQIGKDTVFVELDGKQQAMIERIELNNPDGSIDLAVGDTVRAKVLSVDDQSGAVRLGKSLGRATDLASFELARESGAGVEGKVTGVNKGGIEVDLGKGVRGSCPNSQLGPRGTDAKDLLGTTTSFAVTEIKDGGLVDGAALATADMAYQIDNMEGIGVHRTAGGETVLTLVSDDNFSPIQRTLLLQFTLVGE